jgi:hypothetical protein
MEKGIIFMLGFMGVNLLFLSLATEKQNMIDYEEKKDEEEKPKENIEVVKVNIRRIMSKEEPIIRVEKPTIIRCMTTGDLKNMPFVEDNDEVD